VVPTDGLCFLIPEALAFPRAPYADALETHAKLLAQFQDQLFADARTLGGEDAPFAFLYDYVGLVWAGTKGVKAEMAPRSVAIDRTSALHGICRPLHLVPEGYRFHVVVSARGLASLHTLEIEDACGDAPRLQVVSRHDAFEPRKQEHRAADGHTVTRWVAFDREPRYAWRPTPPEPASQDEIADRLVAFYEAPLRRAIQCFLRAGHAPEDAYVQFGAKGARGDRILVSPRTHAFTLGYPSIGHAILEEPARPGFTPVFVNAVRWGALRWIPVGALAAGAAPPPGMLAPLRMPFSAKELEESLAEEGEDDDEGEDEAAPTPEPAPPAPAPARPSSRKRDVDIVEEILRMGMEGVVDRLTTLTPAELDREIASVGFDPEAERAFGPGLRERVVVALLKKEIAETPDP